MSRRSSGSVEDDIECGSNHIYDSIHNLNDSTSTLSTNITNSRFSDFSMNSSFNNSINFETDAPDKKPDKKSDKKDRNIITKECAIYCESSNPDSELIKICVNKHYMHIECINELITKSKAICPMCRDDSMLKKFKTINNKYDTVDSGMYINTTIIPKNLISTDSFVDITLVDGGVNNKLGFPGLVCTLYSFIFPACVYVILSGLYS